MPGATGALSGPGPQQAYIWLSYHSMNVGGNYTNWYYEALYKGNGYGSWTNSTQYWGLSGFATGGSTFTIPSPGTGDVALGSGVFAKYHNAAGYLSAGNLTLSIDTNHSSIGDGSASVSSGTPPRVPKPPSQSPAPAFQTAEPDSLAFKIAYPTDDGGSVVETYEMQVMNLDGSLAIPAWQSAAANQVTPNPLPPGTTFRVRYRGKNAYGFAPWSAETQMTTESGIYVSDGTKWVGAGVKVSDGTNWVTAIPAISDGDSWEQPLDV